MQKMQVSYAQKTVKNKMNKINVNKNKKRERKK